MSPKYPLSPDEPNALEENPLEGIVPAKVTLVSLAQP
jgi:hypothetical protein